MSVDSDRMQILIIDDNPSLVNIFKKILEMKGFSVTSENTLKKGLQRLQKNQFQVAYVDAPLDGHDEQQILTLLFENKIFSKTFVFLFSSVEFDSSELLRWKNNGLYSYLKKPIERSKIIKELEVLRSSFKINSSSELSDAASDEQEEPTTEQFEKLTLLEKQIRELETISSSDEQESLSTDSAGSLPSELSDAASDEQEEPTPEQFEKLTLLEKQIRELETTRTIKPKSIPGKLLLQNVIDGLRSSTIHSISTKLHKHNASSPKNIKETIQREIQKTISDLSILKNEIRLLDDAYDPSSAATPTKRKLKKSASASAATPTKRKLKKKSSSRN